MTGVEIEFVVPDIERIEVIDLPTGHGQGDGDLPVSISYNERGFIGKTYLEMTMIISNYFKEENMKEIQFSIKINASKGRVWRTLWEDVTFRDWASIIDEGTYMKGVMKEGNEIQFISSVNGYGVTSLIEKLNPNEFVLFKHGADTKESGQQEREKEWSGGTESYSLTEKNGVTTLIVKIDVPQEQEETFNIKLPIALERIKILAEKMQ